MTDELDFIPKDDMDFDLWIHNFLTQLEANPAVYGLTPADLVELKSTTAAWHKSYDAHLKTQFVLRSSDQRYKKVTQHYISMLQGFIKETQTHIRWLQNTMEGGDL